MQPFYRCSNTAASPILARWGNRTDGCPQQYPNVTSTFSDGALGSHGGSGLSGVGGTIRLGELLPESPPIPHALKIELQHQWYYEYGQAKLQPTSSENGGRRQYFWPCHWVGRSGSEKAPGGLYTGKTPHVVPGALLVVPANNNLAMNSTVAGSRLK